MGDDFLQRIRQAKVYEVAIESPLDLAPRLSRRLGHEVRLKREDLQPVFSFKLRGAHNKIAQLGAEAARGVITASAGNHAQGVALAAQRRQVRAVVVMPQTTPAIKVQAVADLGGEVVLHGDVFDSAFEHASELARAQRLCFVHPFDDPDVIAGQGTVGMEIVSQTNGAIDAIFVPVGGGGLIAGIGAYVKQLHPKVRIIGVEPEDAAAMYESLKAGRRVTLEKLGLFADGVAVRRVGEQSFALAQRYVDEIVRVNTDEICAAIEDVFEDTRAILEPAGALAVAGIKRYAAGAPAGQRFVAINSGANLNFDRLRYIAERADRAPAAKRCWRSRSRNSPGSFLKLLRCTGAPQRDRIQLPLSGRRPRPAVRGLWSERGSGELRRRDRAPEGERLRRGGHERQRDGQAARALHDRRRRTRAHRRADIPLRVSRAARRAAGFPAGDRQHLEHYVVSLPQSRLRQWPGIDPNIQVPPAGRDLFLGHLQALGYPYTEETANPAYRSFLAA